MKNADYFDGTNGEHVVISYVNGGNLTFTHIAARRTFPRAFIPAHR